jgi:hypothetical protein
MKKPVKKIQSRGDRTPQIEIDARVQKVSDLLLAGASRNQIVGFCGEKYKVHPHTADRYIEEAREIWKEMVHPERKEAHSKALMRLEALYAKNLSIQDFKACLAVQKEINQLTGVTSNDLTVKHEAGDTLTTFMQKIRAGTLLTRNQPQ